MHVLTWSQPRFLFIEQFNVLLRTIRRDQSSLIGFTPAIADKPPAARAAGSHTGSRERLCEKEIEVSPYLPSAYGVGAEAFLEADGRTASFHCWM